MINILFYFFALIFLLKTIWNIGVPYDLFMRHTRANGQHVSDVSMMPQIEISTFVISLGLSFFSKGLIWSIRPTLVAILGICIIVFTYIHLFAVGFLANRIISKMKSGNP
jgi:hypothetical protein